MHVEERNLKKKRGIYVKKKRMNDDETKNILMATIANVDDNIHETVYLVWLDGSITQSEENLDTQQQFQSIINHLKIFENVQDCEQYIRQTPKDNRICLIVSGRLGEIIVPKIHQYRQVFSIYVYCMDKKPNKIWAKHFTRVKGVIIKLDILLNQLRSDQLKRIKNKIDEPISINLSKLTNSIDKSTNKLNGEFLHSQLLIDCLLRMKSNLTDKTELINLCRKIYKNNPNELNLIKEFEENYQPNQSLWWYTRESFLYRLLNKALRIQNIDFLYLFRFFLRDIENQLKQYQCSSFIRVYRGQLMSMDELNQLQTSLGEYISINSFFSTSLNREKARKFLNSSSSNDLQKILFEIDAYPQLDNRKSFGNISSISYYSTEDEILFMLGSIFRLMNIKQEKNGYWIIQMILSTHNDENFQLLFNNIKKEYTGINHQTSLLSFGNILHQMGKYDLAEKYFHRLLKELPNDHQDISKCYHALAVIALIQENYDKSLSWHKKSIEIKKLNHVELAESYNCIGCIYQKKEELKNALEFYNKALKIWKDSFGDDYYQIADCLNNMGCVYETEKNYSKALECHQRSLAIRKKCLPRDHPDLGASYNNIGNIYLSLEEYDSALENYQYAYEIKTKSLPSEHFSLGSTFENIGLVYEGKQLFDQALIYYKKAAIIFGKTFSSTHIYVIEIEQNIQRILSITNSQ